MFIVEDLCYGRNSYFCEFKATKSWPAGLFGVARELLHNLSPRILPRKLPRCITFSQEVITDALVDFIHYFRLPFAKRR